MTIPAHWVEFYKSSNKRALERILHNSVSISCPTEKLKKITGWLILNINSTDVLSKVFESCSKVYHVSCATLVFSNYYLQFSHSNSLCVGGY